MADMLIDQMWDLTDEEHMDGEEWWGTVGRYNKICRCCKAANLRWGDLNGKWRLFGPDDKVHVCAVKPLVEKQCI